MWIRRLVSLIFYGLLVQQPLTWAQEAEKPLTTPSDVQSPATIELLQGSAVVSASPQEEITLEKALSLAETDNLTLKISETQAREQKWQFYNRLSQFLPDVNPFYNQQKVNGVLIVGGVIPLKVNTRVYTAGVTLQAPVFSGFQTSLNSLAQRKVYQASKADLIHTRETVLLETFQNYQQLLFKKAQIAIAESTLANAQSTLQLNQARFQVGTVPKLDVLEAQAQVAKSQQQLIAAQNDFLIQNSLLAVSLGSTVLKEWLPQESLAVAKVLVLGKPSLAQLAATALSNRADIRRDRLQMQGSHWAQWSSLSDFLPAVVLSQTSQASGQELNSMKHSDISRLDITWNVGKHGGVSALTQFQAKRAQADRARLLLTQTEQRVLQELSQAYYTAQSQEAQIQAAQAELASQTERYRLAKLRLENGLMTTTDLLLAQTDLNQAQQQLASVIFQYNSAQAQLLLATGLLSKTALLKGIELPQVAAVKP